MVLSCDDILTCVSWCSPPPLPGLPMYMRSLRWALAVMAVLLAVLAMAVVALASKTGVELLPHPHPSPPPPQSPFLPCSTGRVSSPSSSFVKLVKDIPRDFPGNPVVRTSPYNAGSTGSVSGWAAELPRAPRPKTSNMKQK